MASYNTSSSSLISSGGLGRKMLAGSSYTSQSKAFQNAVRLIASSVADELLSLRDDDPVKHASLAYFKITPAHAALSWEQVADVTFCQLDMLLALNRHLLLSDDDDSLMPDLNGLVGQDIWICI